MTVRTEKVYMEIHTRVLRVVRELGDVEAWLKEERGIKRYCAEHPEAHRRSMELLEQAKRALVAVPNTFMEGGAAIVRLRSGRACPAEVYVVTARGTSQVYFAGLEFRRVAERDDLSLAGTSG